MAMRDYKFSLLAGVPMSLRVGGNYFGVVKASGDILIRFDDGVQITRQEGTGGSADYSKVEVESPINQVVTLALGEGVMHDGRGTLSGVTVTTAISYANSSPASADVVIPALTQVQVLAPNANRKSALIFAGEANIYNLRIGCNNTVSATQGGILAAGGNGELETETGIWVYNPAAIDQTVNIIELERI